jgi:hypothetical protein
VLLTLLLPAGYLFLSSQKKNVIRYCETIVLKTVISIRDGSSKTQPLGPRDQLPPALVGLTIAFSENETLIQKDAQNEKMGCQIIVWYSESHGSAVPSECTSRNCCGGSGETQCRADHGG